jgi:hypothetical protein
MAGVLLRWLEQLGVFKGGMGGEDGSYHPNLHSKIEEELKQLEASRCVGKCRVDNSTLA